MTVSARLTGSFIFILTIIACAPERLTEEELIDYIRQEENGLIKSWQAEPLKAEVMVRPVDLIISRNYKDEIEKDPAVVDSLRNALAEQVYFVMNLSWNGNEITQQFLQDPVIYQKALSYLSEDMSQDIALTAPDGVSYPVSVYYYTPMYGMVNHSSVLFAFPREVFSESRTTSISLQDKNFGLGRVDFQFKSADILNAPGVRFY